MWVSTETIYQSLYVQSRGALRRDLATCLRTGRALRVPNRQGTQRKNQVLHDMVNVSERPAAAADRAVPGHWAGDLIIGKANASAIGTLVERTTGCTMLVHLPQDDKPEQVAPALAKKIQTLPEALRAGQRGMNENTNGLLRQYFPEGTDLSTFTDTDRDWVADELNDRPRQRLSFRKPIEEIGPLLLR